MKKETGAPELRVLNACVVIETPARSHAKYKYEEKSKVFTLSKILPAGAVFPYNFGFLPHTLAEDGDPLDILVLTDVPVFPGCVVEARLIGVLKAKQTDREKKETTRNDRIIAVAAVDATYGNVYSFRDLSQPLLDEIVRFFVSYNEARGVVFNSLGYEAVESAARLVEEARQKKRASQRKQPRKQAA